MKSEVAAKFRNSCVDYCKALHSNTVTPSEIGMLVCKDFHWLARILN